MKLFHHIRLAVLLLIFGFSTAQAVLPGKTADSEAEKFMIRSKKVVLNDGTVLPSRTFTIERKSDQYLSNVIIIKTKSDYGKLDGSKSFPDGMIQTSIQDLSISNIASPIASYAAKSISNESKVSNIHEIYYSAPIDPFDVCRELMNNPQIEYASPVYKREVFYTPNDPRVSEQYAIAEMNLEAAWNVQKGDSGVTIAIVDSGTERHHEDLADKIWTNPNEIAGDGLDNDNNGKIDDIYGWDLVGNTTSQQMNAGQWQEDNNPTPPTTGNDHGTHVAGCAAAATNNDLGVASPGFNCAIIPVKCGLDNSSGGIYRGYEGIAYAASVNADIINCSWGGLGGSAYEQDVINFATENGSLVVVASGNESTFTDLNPTYPSNYDNVLNVGATRQGKKVASFTNYGREVTVYAPGDEILSTQLGGGYSKKSGTSMASPIIAGLAGLIKAQHIDWTPKQIIHQIRGTSANVINPDLQSVFFGLADAEKALLTNPSLSDGPNRMPGLEVTEVKGNSSDFVFTDMQTQPITFKIHNYLAKSTNTKVELIPLENYLSVSQTTFNLPDIRPHLEEEISTNITLDKSNPWFDGFVQLLVKFEADNYINYQLIKLQIDIESNHNFNVVTTTPLQSTATWHDIASADAQSFWLVGSLYGYYGYFISGSNNSGWESGQLSTPVYAAAAASSTTAYLAASASNGTTKIYKTSTKGSTWTEENVTSHSTFINGIHFWSVDDGIFIGDPQNGSWGIATTLDGGDTWTHRNSPTPLNGETGLVQCTFVNGDNCYFGTTKGRVYVSKNKGRDWLAYTLHTGGVVTYLAFDTPNTGIAIYREKSDSDVNYIASTLDGGKTWNKQVYNLTANSITPIDVAVPAESNQILVFGKNGEIMATENYAQSFTRILNGRFYQSELATLVSSPYSARLWSVGNYITSTDFAYKPADAVRALDLNTDNIDYGSIDTGKVKNRTFTLKSVGNYTVKIDSIKVEMTEGEEGEFSLSSDLQQYIDAGKDLAIRIQFAPVTVGNKSAKLSIYSDAETPLIEATVTGVGTEVITTTKVLEVESNYAFPTVDIGETSNAQLTVQNLGNTTLKITSLSLVGSDKDNFSFNNSNLPLDLNSSTSASIEISFSPKSEGSKAAMLSIVSDADNGVQKVTLTGIGNDPNSVFDSPFGVLELSNYPNPASGMTTIDFVLPESSPIVLNIFDAHGRFVGAIYNSQGSLGKNSVSFSTENLSIGTYFIEMLYKGQRFTHMMTIAR